jgi:hypothetical protein
MGQLSSSFSRTTVGAVAGTLQAEEATSSIDVAVRYEQRFEGAQDLIMGSRIVTIGDLDADGISEFAQATSLYTSDNLFARGRVRIFSGANGALRHEYIGSAAEHKLGQAVASLGDLNQDGVPDYAISDDRDGAFFGAAVGRLTVYSGIDGTQLFSMSGFGNNAHFGSAIAPLEDYNGNGSPDFAVRARAGTVIIYDGVTRNVLKTLKPTDNDPSFGQHGIIPLGDLDGDGGTELAISVTAATIIDEQGNVLPLLTNAGRVDVVNSRTGARLYVVNGIRFDLGFGARLIAVGDITGDGVTDFAAGFTEIMNLVLVSGRTGEILASLLNPDDNELLGNFHGITSIGDVNRDGILDFALSTGVLRDRKMKVQVTFCAGGSFIPFQVMELNNISPAAGMELRSLEQTQQQDVSMLITSRFDSFAVFTIKIPQVAPEIGSYPENFAVRSVVGKRGLVRIRVDYQDDWANCGVRVRVAARQRQRTQGRLKQIALLSGKAVGERSRIRSTTVPGIRGATARQKLYGQITASCAPDHIVNKNFEIDLSKITTAPVAPRQALQRLKETAREI